MPTSLDLEIRSRVAAVLDRQTPLRDFYQWLGPATWGIRASAHPEAAELAYRIEHLFFELSAGDITPRQFTQDLRVAATTYRTIRTPFNRAAGIPFTTTDANVVVETDLTALDLRRRAAAVA